MGSRSGLIYRVSSRAPKAKQRNCLKKRKKKVTGLRIAFPGDMASELGSGRGVPVLFFVPTHGEELEDSHNLTSRENHGHPFFQKPNWPYYLKTFFFLI